MTESVNGSMLFAEFKGNNGQPVPGTGRRPDGRKSGQHKGKEYPPYANKK